MRISDWSSDVCSSDLPGHGRGGKVPVHAAVLANSTMARALDICDFQVPGQHIGSSIVPVALGIAEAKGDVSGRDIITALAVGSEIAIRLGYASRLDGFDPTGACSILAAAAAAARLRRLDEGRMGHMLAQDRKSTRPNSSD